MIAIKGRRRKAFQLIRDRLTYSKRLPFQAKVCQCGHGRHSTWTLRALEAPTTIKEIWPGSALIISVRSAGTREGRTINETRYYVSSLRSTVKALLQHVRDRWSIENSWHWVTGSQLREDAHRYREANGVQILATLGMMDLNALHLDGKHSIAEGIAAVAHDIRALLRLLGWREATLATQ